MYDLVVLGGGAGGLGVAKAAARVGAKVALVEAGKLGGECLHFACIPSKALLKAARVAHQVREAGKFGIAVEGYKVDFPAVMARVREVVAGFSPGDLTEKIEAKGIDVHFGSPAFEAYDTVVVDGASRISGGKFAIATGSRPEIPHVPGLAEAGYLDNRTIWDLAELPESLAIVGAGAVGLEFGQAFARLGTKVTVLDSHEEILHKEDPEAAKALRERLAAEGIGFFLGVEWTGVARKDGKKVLKFRNKKDGSTFEAARTHILVATGRRPNVEGLNLEAAGIHTKPGGWIGVDDYLQTESRHIYALGDVTGRDLYTHAAERESEVVFQNAILKRSKKYRGESVPRTLFTDPEFAAVGQTAAQALHDDPGARVFSIDVGRIDRARVEGETGGVAKVVASASGKVLGATIVGPEASLVLQEFVLAIEHGLSLADLAATTHPYPTYAGAAQALANQYADSRMEKGVVRTALKWFYGFEPAGKA